jgi:hypothetical protein
VLHNERGLSVHFLIDNDGTIYQTLDLVYSAFQAAGANEHAIGVELANRGDAHLYPNAYGGARDKRSVSINGVGLKIYDFTDAQKKAMVSLGKALTRIFPALPQTYPNNAGEPIFATLSGRPQDYSGYLGHYHVTASKWDPGPFDFKDFTSKIRGRMVFPVVLSGDPAVPPEPDKAEAIANTLYESNEQGEGGGYFPVGPYGEFRLWHGGVHIRADKGTKVYAPFAGKIVAARMAEDATIGSRNFVLIKHEMAVGSAVIKFWTLLFHLDKETVSAEAPAWFNAAATKLGDDPVALDIDVAAGDLVGHVGEAGPPGRAEGQIHVEIMSAEEIGEKVEPGFWHAVEGASMGRLCNVPEIVDKIDKPSAGGRKDGKLSRLELLNFYRSDPAREEFRKLAVHHLSEWADPNDWRALLTARTPSGEFAALKPQQRDRMFREQIEPVLWWTDEVAAAAGLPDDKVVWNYHPITFIVWLHDRVQNARTVAKGIGDESAIASQKAPANIQDDATATEGFTDDEDTLYGEQGKKLELEDLANGFPDEKGK